MTNLTGSETEKVFLTVAYFNLLGYPPTAFEIWRHLLSSEKNSLFVVVKNLDYLVLEKKLFQKSGFYFFPEQKLLVKKRQRGKKIAVKKIKRMNFWVGWLKNLPFVRGVFVRGALALGTADNSSDWDALVVTAKKRIWLGRLGMIICLILLRKRRSGRTEKGAVKDRFCLNHFLSEDGLILEKQNQFIAHEESFSFPLWGREIHKKFLQLNYFWLKQKRANFEIDQLDFFWTKKWERNSFNRKIESFGEKIGWAEKFNRWAKYWMIKLIKSNPKTAWPEADIRYSDQALIFIPNPWRDKLEKKAKAWIAEKINNQK